MCLLTFNDSYYFTRLSVSQRQIIGITGEYAPVTLTLTRWPWYNNLT